MSPAAVDEVAGQAQGVAAALAAVDADDNGLEHRVLRSGLSQALSKGATTRQPPPEDVAQAGCAAGSRRVQRRLQARSRDRGGGAGRRVDCRVASTAVPAASPPGDMV